MISDVADSTGVENNYMAFTEQGESILPNNALLAHTKDISISIKPNNRVLSSDLSEIYNFAELNSINLSSDIDLYYLYINSLDIDGDNVDEYVYSASLANGLDEYKSFVFLKKDNKYILIDKVESENKGVANTSLIFNNLIDFNNDGEYEFVVGKVMSEYGPDYYELYNLDSEKFTRIGVEE